MRSVKTDERGTIKLDEGEEDSQNFGYIVDLGSFKFDEDSLKQWVQAMPLGTWMHPEHGAIVISKDRVKTFADNVNNNVRGQDLDIDYDHKKLRTDAAGWVQSAKVVTTGDPKQRGLWVLVEWTKSAASSIQEKAFRYFSPEFHTLWKNPATGKVYKDVLFGGAITNRPFLKGILPLNLSELMEANEDDNQGDEDMDRKVLETLASNLKVEFTEDTSDEDLTKLVTDASVTVEDDGGDDTDSDDENEKEEVVVNANEDALVKLAETNPAVALLLAEREENNKRLQALEISNKLAGAQIKLSEVKTDDTVLTPAIKTQLSEVLVNSPTAVGDSVLKIVQELVKGKGTVELGERGTSGDSGSDSDDAGTEFAAKVAKLMEANDGKMTFADATIEVSLNDPELADQYRNASYAFKEVD